MKMKEKLNGYYNYTVILTYLGMLFGFTGIVYITEGEHSLAIICLMIAGVCDMFDGAVAATKQSPTPASASASLNTKAALISLHSRDRKNAVGGRKS